MADPGEARPPGPAAQPFLRIVKGEAAAEEIAALVAALAAVAATRSNGAGESEPGCVRNEWSDKARLLRSPVHPAPGGWRRSALP